jgi:PEP-CTERM motif
LDSAVTGLTGEASWAVSTAGGPGPRLVEVNVDLFDVNNTLVSSDTNVTVTNGVASSILSGAIGPGNYTLVATGVGLRDTAFNVALSFTGAPSGGGAASAGGVPTQGPVADAPTVFFSKLSDTRTVTPILSPGETLNVDSLVTTETGPLSQTVAFTVGPGADGITGLADWLVSTADGPGPRLIEVGIDVFDASNVLVGTDTNVTVVNGVASSAFDFSLAPGDYKLVATGVGLRDSSLDIALSVTGSAVPEPPTRLLLLMGALAAGAMFVRRRWTSDAAREAFRLRRATLSM